MQSARQRFDPGTVPDPTDPANLERIGGRGLMLIRTFMDEVEHNEKGNRIILRKRYPTAECPRTPTDSR
jgi:anti-sigma regulatory factor (Ser/Thr protein kinase)